ncbi:MAG: efflux RND transporter periplasmic adaptor subunit [Anaerolineales bacterium]|nr:efflux RND transporter periplasmic adaptor subunit [Anaerolineales bacterium]
MNLNKYILLSILIFSLTMLYSCNGQEADEHDHTSHEQAETTRIVVEAEETHTGAMDIFLTDAQQQQAGIKLAAVALGSISEIRRIYGEIRLNEDRLIHQYPKYPGIVRNLQVNIGQTVNSGDTLATIFNTETLSLYPVISAIRGEILEKHAVVGAVIHGADPLLVIGNLETVWVDLHVFEKDHGLIKKGQSVTLFSIDGTDQITTKVRYMKPVMNVESRTYIVRCMIGNSSRHWNPGRFVYGEIEFEEPQSQSLVVPENSIQNYESKQVVFVPEGLNNFEAVPIITGRKAQGLVEIISGLELGDQIVSQGAFFIKSELVTQSSSGHVGHGH